jgi:hypothetical protein
VTKALPYLIAVGVGYLLLVIVCFWVVPKPWNLVGAGVVTLMAVRFFATVNQAKKLGTRRPTSGT